MPEYTYVCQDCNRIFTVRLSYSEYGKVPVHCPRCGSGNVQRRIGRVRFIRSFESRVEDLADPGTFEELERNPKALARMMRAMSAELGEDLGPELEEVVSRLERGESPEEIEKSMPELAGEEGEAPAPADDAASSDAEEPSSGSGEDA